MLLSENINHIALVQDGGKSMLRLLVFMAL